MTDVLPYVAQPLAQPAADPAPLLVSAKQLAKLLDVGLRTVRTWDAGGKLPEPVRIGGAVRWHLDEIRAWIDAGAPDRATWNRMHSANTKPPAR